MFFKKQFSCVSAIGHQLFHHPELGYKEFSTQQQVIRFITDINPTSHIEHFSTTGLVTRLGTNKTLNIALIAELDAVYAPSHWCADQQTGAAHNCGHHSQVAIMLALYHYFYANQTDQQLDFSLTFIFVPAEEYVDLAYRQQLMASNTIDFYSGKAEAMKLGVFDDVDIGIAIHAIGEELPDRTIEINCDLAGFLYKKYAFHGKASHAGFDPFSGLNAYSMSTLFNVGVGLMRQHIRDDEHVRINPIVMQSDMSTNVVPNYIKVGSDLRSRHLDYLSIMAHKLDTLARGSASSLGGEVTIETQLGDLPFVQHRYLNQFVKSTFDQQHEINTLLNERFISAAGDIGDLSFMLPCIQIGYSGFTGTIHGDDFKETDTEMIYEIFPRFMANVLHHMSGKIDPSQLYKKTFADYQQCLNNIAKTAC